MHVIIRSVSILLGVLICSLTVSASESLKSAVFDEEALAQSVMQPPLKKQRVEEISAIFVDADFKETFAREHAEQQKLDTQVQAYIIHYAKIFYKNSAQLSEAERKQEEDKYHAEFLKLNGDINWPKRSALYQVATCKGFNLENISTYPTYATALLDATCKNDASCVRFLLQHKADPNKQVHYSTHGNIPVINESRTLSVAQLLLDHKAEINATNKNGETVIWPTFNVRSPALVSFLIARGINMQAVNKNNETVLEKLADKIELWFGQPGQGKEYQQEFAALISAGFDLGQRSTAQDSLYGGLTIIEKLKVKIKLGRNPEANAALLELLRQSAQARSNQIKNETIEYMGRHLARIVDEYDATGRFDQPDEEIDKLAALVKQNETTKPLNVDKHYIANLYRGWGDDMPFAPD